MRRLFNFRLIGHEILTMIKKITIYDYKACLKSKLFKKCQRSHKYLRQVPALEKKIP